MAKRAARLLALVLGAALGSCSLTIDEDELGGQPTLTCGSKQKECAVEGVPECVGLDDPSVGCSRRNCIPCNLPKATAICSPASGECVVGACHGTWDDCDRVSSNGCEVNTANDVRHCGRCSQPCPSKPNAEVACGGTHCYIRVCDRGFKDCNDEFDDGCEIDTTSDLDNCGDCDQPCSGACSKGVCSDT